MDIPARKRNHAIEVVRAILNCHLNRAEHIVDRVAAIVTDVTEGQEIEFVRNQRDDARNALEDAAKALDDEGLNSAANRAWDALGIDRQS